jgi:hypothetical protein
MKQNDSLHRQFKTVSPAIRQETNLVGSYCTIRLKDSRKRRE